MNKKQCVARLQQKTTNQVPWVRRVAKAVLVMYLWQCEFAVLSATAQAAESSSPSITSVSTSPAGQRPLIDATANGVPLVHIAPPNSAGVSHNQYGQFNVNQNGAILNNSTGTTQTQLGGLIAGNLQMGPTPARLILNEVVTANPSLLYGTIEIAGRRADIVIANPNGITCDGCGFLNTGRASLTTGTPRFGEGGSLNGFNVRQGQVTIGSQGLTATNVEQLDLIARGMVIEGEVWTNNLNAIAGANHVLYASLQAITQAGQGTAPRFVIDIKDVGGMYANQIFLVATEQGLGVNSQGRVAALQGNLTLSSNGDLILKDSHAKKDVQFTSTGNTTLTGLTVSEGNTSVASSGNVNLSGIVDVNGQLTISATQFDNSGELTQRGTDTFTIATTGAASNSGTIQSAGQLDLRSASFTDTHGTLRAANDLNLQSQSINLSGTKIVSDRKLNLDATSTGDITANNTNLYAAGELRAIGSTNNTAGFWQGGQSVLMSGVSIINQGGTIQSGGVLDVAVIGAVDNSNGKLLGADNVKLTAGSLINDGQAQIISQQTTQIDTTGIISNQNSVISGKTSLDLHTHGNALNNTGGVLVSDAGLTVNAKTLTNIQGSIISNGLGDALTHIKAATIDNQQGIMDVANGLDITTPGRVNNLDGVIQAGVLTLQSSDFDNTGGKVLGKNSVTLTVGTLSNNAHVHSDIPTDFAVIASTQGSVSITAGEVSNRTGLITSAAGTDLNTRSLNNNSGEISSKTLLTINTNGQGLTNDSGNILAKSTITLTTGELSNVLGVITADERVAINSSGAIINSGEITSDGQISIAGTAMDNTAGIIHATQDAQVNLGTGSIINEQGEISGTQSLTLKSGEVRNQGGALLSGSGLELNTQGKALDNSNGKIIAKGDVALITAPLTNSGGTVASLQGKLTINNNRQAFDNQGGKLQAAGDTTITAGDTDNRAGLISGTDVTLDTGNLDNTDGEVIAGNKLSADTQELNNDQGLLMSMGDSRIDTHGQRLTVTRSGDTGGIVASGALEIIGGTLYSPSGYIASNGRQTLTLTGDLDNRVLDGVAGKIVSNGDITVKAANILNNGGAIDALGIGSLTAGQTIDNRGGRIAVSGDITLNSATLDNSALNRTAGQIDAGAITIGASTLVNTGGVLNATNDAVVTAATLDNIQGTISAKRNLTVTAATLNNTNGTLVGDQRAAVTTHSQAPGGTIASNNDVTLTIQGDYLNTGLLSSRKDLTINASSITNSGTLIANNTLAATTTGDLTNVGEMSAYRTLLNVGGILTNSAAGLIDGTFTDIRAKTINNIARIYGDDLSLAGNTINNSGPGIMGARNLMLMGAQAINNTNGGVLFSLGDMVIGGALDSTGNVTDLSNSLFNGSSTIEARGDLYIGVNTLTNHNDALIITPITDPSIQEVKVQPRGSSTQYPASQCFGVGGKQDKVQCQVHPDKYGQRSTIAPVQVLSFLGINYRWDAPEFVRFDVKSVNAPPTAPPNSNCGVSNSKVCVQWKSDYAKWNTGYQSALDQLSVKINTYNAEIKEDNRVVEFEDYTLYHITSTRSHEEVSSSAPARILSGGDITINGGEVNNSNSQIVAGRNLIGLGDKLENNSVTIRDTTTYSGTQQYTQVNSCGFFGNKHCRAWGKEADYSPADKVDNKPLLDYTVKQNTNLTASKPLNPSTTAPSDMAASAVTAATGNERVSGLSDIKTTLPPSNYVPPIIYSVAATGTDGGARDVIITTPPRLDLPDNRLFVLHPEPEAKYLIETDPQFIRNSNFVGSDYFFAQLNLDPERHLKRYGDGFYEQQLVNDQILALTNHRYLTDYSTSEEQYQSLMEAGATFARDYQLTPGVALTGKQMEVLTTDMVWLTSQTVTLADGSTTQVLVPQVYLRHPEGSDLHSDGSLVAGETVNIKTRGGLNNSGTIAARKSATLIIGDDLVNQGGRISGQNVIARARNDLINLSGIVEGRGLDSQVSLQAGRDLVLQTNTLNTTNTSGSSTRTSLGSTATVQGSSVRLDAGRDLLASGSTVDAAKDLTATAGRDITAAAVASRYQIQSNDTSGHSVEGRSGYIKEESTTHQVATFSAGNNATLVAGNNATFNGTDLTAGTDALLRAANVRIASVKDSQSNDIQTVGNDNYDRVGQDKETLVGGSFIVGNSLEVVATGLPDVTGSGNLTVTGATITANTGQASLLARNDITLQNTTTAHRAVAESHDTGGNFFQTVTTNQSAETIGTQVTGSNITGNTVLIQAGHDVRVTGSNVVSDVGTRLIAANDVNIEAATGTHNQTQDADKKTSGLMGTGGIGFTIGTRKQATDNQASGTYSTASTVGSTQGDVDIQAGKNYRQMGSDVLAPQGNIDIVAQRIDITEAKEAGRSETETYFSESGLTGSLTSPVLSALQTTQQMKEAGSQTKDRRMQALAAGTATLAAKNAYDAVASDPMAAGGINISITIGGSKSESKQTQTNSVAKGSAVAASGNVNLTATGADKDSDITIQGSNVTAGNNATLKADDEINLLAAQNNADQRSSNSSKSAGVGLAISYGSGGFAAGITLSASAARGKADGNDVTWSNTHVEAGNKLTLESGGDTNLKGAVASGKQVVADIGGDLNIESLQDTSVFKSKNQAIGGSVTVGAGFAASVNLSQQKMDSNFASVTEQSAIKAGDEGFNINVKGNTDLKGAVIASNDQAVLNDNNSLTTKTLTTSDIKNRADYDASSFNIGGGYTKGNPMVPLGGGKNTTAGAVGTNQQGDATTGGAQTPGSTLPSHKGFSATTPVAMSASDSAASTTKSGISGAAITITDDTKQRELTGQDATTTIANLNRDVSSDKDSSNALKPIFNEQEIKAGFEIVGALARETGTFLDNRAKEADAKTTLAKKAEQQASDPTNGLSDEQRLALRDQSIQLREDAQNISDNWGAGGTYRQITTALAAAASGNISASSSEFAKNMVVNYVQQQGATYIGKLVAEGTLTEGSPLHAALHGIVACGGAAASNQDCGAGALGAASSSLLTGLFSETSPDETQTEREAKAHLITSIVTGLAAVTDTNATTASAAATSAVDNNWLATQQIVQMNKELKAAETLLDELKVLGKWGYISTKQDVLTTSGIGKGLAESGWNDVKGLAEFLTDPITGLKGLKDLITDDNARQQMGDALFAELDTKIDRMSIALEQGGDQNAEQLGKDLGALIWQVGAVATGVGAAAKGGVMLAKAGINVGSQSLVAMKITASLLKAESTGLGGVVALSEVGMEFGKGIVKQGKPFEAYVQSRLPSGTLDLNTVKSNFSTFDHLTPDLIAVSTKTLNTADVTYQNSAAITSTLNGYVNKMDKFVIDEKKGRFTLYNDHISSKQMQLGVPYNTTAEQMTAIAQSVQYAASKGIQVVVTKVK